MFHIDLSRQDEFGRQAVEPDPGALIIARRSLYLAFLRRRIADPDAAEDVLQDFTLKVIRATRRAAPVRHTDAWLARVLRNTLLDHYRRRDARRRAEAAYADDIQAHARQAATQPDPCDAQSQDDELALVEAALARLRPEYATLIRALYLHGLPRETMARDLALEVGTLNVRAFRARRALRDEVVRLTAGPGVAAKLAPGGSA